MATRRTWLKRTLIGGGVALGLLLLWSVWALFGPLGNGIPVGPQTTVLDGPLDAAGYVDYAAAYREASRIPPAENAAVPIFRVTQAEVRRSIPAPQYAAACEDLGVSTEPDPATQFPRVSSVPPPEGWEDATVDGRTRTWNDVVNTLWERPWAAADHPHVAALLRGGDAAFGVLREGLDRPGYWFFPDYGGPLYAHRLPMVQECRDVARSLLARAMLRVGEGDFDGAAADIDRTRTLGRAVAKSPFLIGALVAVAVDATAWRAEVELLHVAEEAAFLRRRLAALDAYDADVHRRRMAVTLGGIERYSALDLIQLVDRERRGIVPPGSSNFLGVSLTGLPAAAERVVVRRVDLAETSRRVNRFTDAAERAFEAGSEEAADEAVEGIRPESFAGNVFGRLSADKAGRRLASLVLPAVGQSAVVAFRAKTKRELLRVLAAGRLFRIETGRPPAMPEDLVPKYLPKWPTDFRDGRPLRHRTFNGVWSVYGLAPTVDRPPPDDLPDYLSIEFPRRPREAD